MKTKCCATCGETKPLAQFNKRLTLAQTKAYLQNPTIQTRFTVQSKNCRDCRHISRRRTPLTANEIRSKISTGDIRPYIGEAMLKEMREQLPRKRSKVMREYWQGKKNLMTVQRKKAIQQQVAQYANRYNSYKTQLKNIVAKNETPTSAQLALLEQHLYNYNEAKRVRQDLLAQIDAGTSVPEGISLSSLFKTKRKE